jgi:hypothetical protein
MDKKNIAYIIVILVTISAVVGFFVLDSGNGISNISPEVEVSFPSDGSTVSGIVLISGTAFDEDSSVNRSRIQVSIQGKWYTADGFEQWSYEWNTFDLNNGEYTISVRADDGIDYSDVKQVTVTVDNPDGTRSDSHKWAVFVAAANAADDDEKKLGNGGLSLAEQISSYMVENLGYSTSNIFILFDDGWIRSDNGYGERLKTLQQRDHKYDFNYGSATVSSVKAVTGYVKEKSNNFEDSEVFFWFFGHGWGDSSKEYTGGKVFQRSAIFLWDGRLLDSEFGGMLSDLESEETCVIVDACFSGGFADKTILSFPELFLLKSDLNKPGRVVMTGASKFREGWTSTVVGPLFTNLWFEGLKTGHADGFRPGVLNIGRKPVLNLLKDGQVSVEEAFYYASYTLRTTEELNDFADMQPQINDNYPKAGVFGNNKGLFLG